MAVSPGFAASRNVQVSQARGLAIRVDGLATVRAVLRETDKESLKALRQGLKDAGDIVAERARQRAPRRSGALARSIRVSARGNTISIRSNLPYANVIHWGGSVGRGHRPGSAWSGSTNIRPSLFISRALDESEDRVMASVEQAMDTALTRAGWR